jgi:hypothetical protein
MSNKNCPKAACNVGRLQVITGDYRSLQVITGDVMKYLKHIAESSAGGRRPLDSADPVRGTHWTLKPA